MSNHEFRPQFHRTTAYSGESMGINLVSDLPPTARMHDYRHVRTRTRT
jgi:hypothetical protein